MASRTNNLMYETLTGQDETISVEDVFGGESLPTAHLSIFSSFVRVISCDLDHAAIRLRSERITFGRGRQRRLLKSRIFVPARKNCEQKRGQSHK